jgi:group I intron endonuclease
MGYIYMLKSPSGKIYIGQTIRSIQTRLKEHQKGSNVGCRAIYNAIQYHGWENFEKVWYECPDEDLNFDEELLIREMETMAPGGYNLKEGGANGKHSEETKQKISEALRGDKHPMYGKIHTEGAREKMSDARKGDKNPMYGKTLSKEHKQKLSEARRGNPIENNPMYGKTGEKHHSSKRVYQYDINNIFIRSFGSAEEAGRYIEKSGSKISMCARCKRKTAYGYKWSYVKY